MPRRNGPYGTDGHDGHDEDERPGKTPVAEEPLPAGESAEGGEADPPEAKGLTPVDPPPAAAEDVDTLRRQRDELKDRLLRKSADFENYRKRVERDRQQAGLDAAAAALKALLPTLDNLDRALSAEAGDASLREGVELIRRDLLG